MKKIVLIVLAIVVVVVALKFLKDKKQEVQNLAKPKEMTKSVNTTRAKVKTLSKSREFLAQIQASNSAYIASKFSATIKKIYVSENDVVEKGALLISLDDSEIKANLNSLNEKKRALDIDLINSKKNLNRNKKLLKIEAISREAYDNSNVVYQNKLALFNGVADSIKQVKSQLQYLNIKAPFNGIVGSKSNDEGSLALAGKAILTLNSNDQKLIFSFVDNNKPIIQGQKVYINNSLVGEILRRYDDAKNSLLVAEVKPYKSLPFANKSYKTIDVEVDKLKGCSLPLKAILHQKNKTSIMVYANNKFTSRDVEILLQNEDDVIISQCPSELVAVSSEAKLSILPALSNIIINEDK